MAQPRFNGRGFSNPLNPLGFHSENRYREPTPIGSNFQQYEAETRVFEAVASAVVKGGIKTAAKKAAAAAVKAARKAGATKAVAKQIGKKVGNAVKKAGDDAAELAAKAGDDAAGQANKALKAMDGAVDDVAGEGIEAGTKGSMKASNKAAMKGALDDSAQVGTKAGKMSALTKGAGGLVAQTAIPLAAAYVLINMFGGDGPIADFFDDLTGANCDEKAEQKYGEDSGGTDEYEEYVEKCHDEASKKMMIFSGIGLAVIGGIIFMLVK
tara:strand:- start:843 stop:1646 length:804 start_codon:yes stop_codon:yes gene_type:complete